MIPNVIKTKKGIFREAGRYLERIAAPLFLIIYPFAGILQGVDVADTTYALSNYTYIKSLDPMWLLATWIPNILGSAFTKLPGGGSMAGMNAWCTAVIAVTALAVWYGTYVFKSFKRAAVFAGLFITESLCWCPAVILYNYLTYLFMTLASLLLILAFSADPGTDEGEGKRMRYLACAGLFLGLNLFVRFPNAVEVLLILAVWYDSALVKGESKKFTAVKDTIACVAGYVTGVIIPLVIIFIRYGASSYFNMISSLFSMTGQAEDYTPGGMVLSILGAYATTLKELLPAVIIILVCSGAFYLVSLREPADGPKTLRHIAVLLCALLLALLFRFYLAWGVITRNYGYYDSFFELAMMALIISLAVDVLAVAGFLKAGRGMRSAAALSLLIILISPLGSNNYTFPAVNNLFIVLPVTISILPVLCRRIREPFSFPLAAWITVTLLALAFQGTVFHFSFAFGDGTDGTPRDAVVSEALPRAAGMHTASSNAALLEELKSRLDGEAASQSSAIVFGNAPGLHYLMELPPALFTSWPELDSNETGRISAALDELSADHSASGGDWPLVIIRSDASAPADSASSVEKAELILDYIAKNRYNKLFEVENGSSVSYTVYGRE